MIDDEPCLALSNDLIDVAIVEVKTNDPCTLNGPWTEPERQNVNRVLAAIGCIPRNVIDAAATEIYQHGVFELGSLRPHLTERFPQVRQVTWRCVLDFMWERFRKYRRQKREFDCSCATTAFRFQNSSFQNWGTAMKFGYARVSSNTQDHAAPGRGAKGRRLRTDL